MTNSIKKTLLFSILVTLIAAGAIFSGIREMNIVYSKYSAINALNKSTEDTLALDGCYFYPISVRYGEAAKKIKKLQEVILKENIPSYLGIYPLFPDSAGIKSVVLSETEPVLKYKEINLTARSGAASKFYILDIDKSLNTLTDENAFFYPLNEGLSKAGIPVLLDGRKIDYSKTYNEGSTLEIIASSGLGLSAGDICYVIPQDYKTEKDSVKEALVCAEVVGICSPGSRLPGRLDYTYYFKSASDFNFDQECIYFPSTFKLINGENDVINAGLTDFTYVDYYILFSSYEENVDSLSRIAAEKADVYNGGNTDTLKLPISYLFEDTVMKSEYKTIIITLVILCGTVAMMWAAAILIFASKIRKEYK